ncbi:hypothetical protein B0H34DRAFT_773851 [Crassisporium funariophilum]|nr:hypothetical protein B0H34DRAFT_773851 [Crassisporium funariophilum]
MNFRKDAIFATAFVSTYQQNSFHYTLSLMLDDDTAMKIHVRELVTDHFTFEAEQHSLRTSRTLCTALHIGNLGDTQVADVVEMLKKIPLTLPDCDKEIDHRFHCRNFLKQCIRSLNDAGIIRCPDASALVDGELKTYAEENGDAILLGGGTYKIKKSKICS